MLKAGGAADKPLVHGARTAYVTVAGTKEQPLSATRIRALRPLAAVAALGAIYGWAVFASTFHHPGAIGLDYTAPGTDWMVFLGAIRLALTHHFALTTDWAAFTAHLNATFAAWLPRPLMYRPWVYPPSFLVLLWPFGRLGFMASFAAFQLCTAALLALGLLAAPRDQQRAGWIAAAAILCPAAAVNACFGQCGLLVAGMLVLGTRLLPARPLLAGAVFGLLSVKPQFALMVPILLLAQRRWQAIAAAATSAASLAVASIALFGPDPWRWWIAWMRDANGNAGSAWAINGRLWGTDVYACAALLHLPAALCTALQLAAAIAAAAAVWSAARRRLTPDHLLAVLLAAAVLASPHVGTYDQVLLAIAALLWLGALPEPSFKDGLLALLLWLVPFFEPAAIMPAGRLVPLLIAGFILRVLSDVTPIRAAPATLQVPA